MLRLFVLIAAISLISTSAMLRAEAGGPAPTPAPVSGCLNQTISDGFWNLKVTKVGAGVLPTDTDVSALFATFTFGPSQAHALVPNDYGVGEPYLMLKDATTVDMNTGSVLAYQRDISLFTFKPGGTKSGTYWFPTKDLLSKLTTFVLPVGTTGGFLHRPYGYTRENPAFRVDLTCNKSG